MTTTAEARLPHRRVLQFAALVSTLDRFALAPMILAISRDLHAPVATVAHAAGGYFLGYGVMQALWGLIGGRFGVVRLLRLTSFVAAVTTMASALAPGAASLIMLRVLAGAAFSAAFPSALFYVGVTVTPEHRHREVTGLMTGVALGTSVATAGAGVVAATIGWRAVFLGTGSAALALVVSLRALPELPHAPATGGLLAPLVAVLRSSPARTLLLLATAEGGIILGTLTFLPAAADRAGSGPAVAGLVTAAYGVAVLVFAPVVGRLHRRVRPATFIATGASCAAVGCGLAAASVRPPATAAVCVLLGAAWASMHSTLQTWSTQVAPQAGLAAVSLFAASLFAGSALGTVFGGRFAGEGAFAVVFAAASVLAVPLGVLGAIARNGFDAVVEPM